MIEKHGLFKAESNKKGCSFIYAHIAWENAESIVRQNMGKFSTPWLIRDSSVNGMLSITYFKPESNDIHHRRIYFNGTEWFVAPTKREEAEAITKQCQSESSDNLSESGAALLASFLSTNGYDAANLIHPPETQATKNKFYDGYDIGTINTLNPYAA